MEFTEKNVMSTAKYGDGRYTQEPFEIADRHEMRLRSQSKQPHS